MSSQALRHQERGRTCQFHACRTTASGPATPDAGGPHLRWDLPDQLQVGSRQRCSLTACGTLPGSCELWPEQFRLRSRELFLGERTETPEVRELSKLVGECRARRPITLACLGNGFLLGVLRRNGALLRIRPASTRAGQPFGAACQRVVGLPSLRRCLLDSPATGASFRLQHLRRPAPSLQYLPPSARSTPHDRRDIREPDSGNRSRHSVCPDPAKKSGFVYGKLSVAERSGGFAAAVVAITTRHPHATAASNAIRPPMVSAPPRPELRR
jgi:hypothetical protein